MQRPYRVSILPTQDFFLLSFPLRIVIASVCVAISRSMLTRFVRGEIASHAFAMTKGPSSKFVCYNGSHAFRGCFYIQ